jgi:SAM-dependent methyltransferase
MWREYRERGARRWIRAVDRLLAWPGDLRTRRARQALSAVLEAGGPGAFHLSIGGGPSRVHPSVVNLNLAPFENVDLVGTAYQLPFAEGAVQAVHCEAVIEHLEHPEVAVREIFRVLRPGGAVYAATPFLQVYHGYPDHYQNYTVTGHTRLFERAGFEIQDAGVAVGPGFALMDIARNFARSALRPRLLGAVAYRAVTLLGLPVRILDLLLNRSPAAHTLASLTFLRARKPAPPRGG